MEIKSLKTKWLNIFFAIAFITVFFNIFFYIFQKQYFYNKIKQNLNLQATNDELKIEQIKNTSTTGLNLEIRNLINSIKSKNVTAIGFDLNEKATTSSNNIDSSIYDEIFYTIKRKKLNLNQKTFQTHLNNGLHIMFKIKPILEVNCEFSSIMYISILNSTDFVIFKNTILGVSISLFILILSLILIFSFIKQTIDPLKKLCKLTKKLVVDQTNFNTNPKLSFELKELQNSIKVLARKIKQSEFAQNEFISSISHELRTPLTAIQGWSETILNSKTDEKILNKGMQIVSNEVIRLSKMVEDLLDFSKIKNDHLTLFKEKIDPFAELQEAVLFYSKTAQQQNKTLIYEESPSTPIIFGDKNRIKQVFINIIDNALKYSDKGSIVTIYTNTTENFAQIFIKDTGKGISKQDIGRLTEKFFQTSVKNKGSGIGLAIVKEIVQKHNGQLNFTSTPGKGTTVKISFPLVNN